MSAALQRLRRRVDRRYYRALHALARLAFPAPDAGAPVDPAALRRVLVLPNYKVGDLVVATPALSYLRDVAPHARIDAVVSPRNASLLDGDQRVDRLIVHDPARGSWPALVRDLRRARYDAVVDLVFPHHGREGLLSALVARPGGARVSPMRPAGYVGLFTHAVRVPNAERRHMADRMLYTLRAAFGEARPGEGLARWPMSLVVGDAADARAATFLSQHLLGHHRFVVRGDDRFVAFNAWGSDHTRTFTHAQAVDVLTRLAARHRDLAFVLTPPPGRAEEAAAIVRSAAAARLAVFPPSPHLGDLAALLRRATLIVSPDTAVVHMAAALGRPTVAVYTTYATRHPSQWTPRGVPHEIVVVERPRLVPDVAPDAIVAAFDALRARVGPRTTGTAAPEPAAAIAGGGA